MLSAGAHRVLAIAIASQILACRDTLPGPEPEFLEVAPSSRSIDPGDVVQLRAAIGDEPAPVTWATSDAHVATVNANGLVQSKNSGFAAITATLVGDPEIKRSANLDVRVLPGIPLTAGQPVPNLFDDRTRGSGVVYRIFVPEGTTALTITTSGGTGDVDLYVRRGFPPTNTTSGSSHRSFAQGNNESVVVTDPDKGTWYILLDLWEAYAGLTLLADYTP